MKSGEDDDDDLVSVEFGKTSAFGKRLKDEHEDSGGSGVAIACPSKDASV